MYIYIFNVTSSLAIAERLHCMMSYLFPRLENCKRDTIFYRHYMYVLNHYGITIA